MNSLSHLVHSFMLSLCVQGSQTWTYLAIMKVLFVPIDQSTISLIHMAIKLRPQMRLLQRNALVELLALLSISLNWPRHPSSTMKQKVRLREETNCREGKCRRRLKSRKKENYEKLMLDIYNIFKWFLHKIIMLVNRAACKIYLEAE